MKIENKVHHLIKDDQSFEENSWIKNEAGSDLGLWFDESENSWIYGKLSQRQNCHLKWPINFFCNQMINSVTMPVDNCPSNVQKWKLFTNGEWFNDRVEVKCGVSNQIHNPPILNKKSMFNPLSYKISKFHKVIFVLNFKNNFYRKFFLRFLDCFFKITDSMVNLHQDIFIKPKIRRILSIIWRTQKMVVEVFRLR